MKPVSLALVIQNLPVVFGYMISSITGLSFLFQMGVIYTPCPRTAIRGLWLLTVVTTQFIIHTKKHCCGVGVGKNVPTPTPTSI
jgi:hypothetical protein